MFKCMEISPTPDIIIRLFGVLRAHSKGDIADSYPIIGIGWLQYSRVSAATFLLFALARKGQRGIFLDNEFGLHDGPASLLWFLLGKMEVKW